MCCYLIAKHSRREKRFKMCNLNLFFRTKQPLREGERETISSFIYAVTFNSYRFNNDADGLFMNGERTFFIKSTADEKINTLSHEQNITDSTTTIITHQRIATSGISPAYHQPFKKNGFVLAHNGVLSEYTSQKTEIKTAISTEPSDTYMLFERFLNEFEQKKEQKGREKAIITALQQCLNAQQGSYSIILYDEETGISYYVKNNKTTITGTRTDSELYITTEEDNLLFMPLLRKNKHKTVSFEDYIIYRIESTTQKVEVKKIGKTKPAKAIYYTNAITYEKPTINIHYKTKKEAQPLSEYEKMLKGVFWNAQKEILCSMCDLTPTQQRTINGHIPICSLCADDYIQQERERHLLTPEQIANHHPTLKTHHKGEVIATSGVGFCEYCENDKAHYITMTTNEYICEYCIYSYIEGLEQQKNIKEYEQQKNKALIVTPDTLKIERGF